jgi:hypothetical protein
MQHFQAPGEASSFPEKTSSSSNHEVSLLNIFWGLPGFRSEALISETDLTSSTCMLPL